MKGDTLTSEEETSEARSAEDLVRRIRAGEQSAETSLVERYSQGLLFMLRRRTKNFQLSDDLHQETFMIVLAKIKEGKVNEPARLGGYIHRVAVNLVIADHRKATARSKRRDGAELDRIEDPGVSQLEGVCIEEEAKLVRRVIGELRNERDREILLRFYVAEQEKEHIMMELGLSTLHFNRVLYRARQRFAEQWSKGPGAVLSLALLFILIGILRVNVSVTQ